MTYNLPLLSIVIPTRNRFDYVQYSVKSALRIPDRDIELVVEDNSDTNEFEKWLVENVTDSRLRYAYSQIPVSMSENYNRAMSRVNGEYVCLMGDDDGINSVVVDAVRWAKEKKVDALLPNNCANYVWPDLILPAAGAIAPAALRILPFSGAISYLNAEKEIQKCLQDAAQNFHKLPKVYYGIIKTDCMKQVKEKTGTFFPGISPDMAAAISSANFVKKMCFIDFPFFIPGSSKNSNAGLSGLGKHIGQLKDQPHLPNNCEETWSDMVPPFYSVETVWAESAVEAIIAIGRIDLLPEFNVPKLYSALVMWHPEYLKKIFMTFSKALHSTKRDIFTGSTQFIYYFLSILRLRAYSLFRHIKPHAITTNSTEIHGLQNIDEAVASFAEYLENNHKQIDTSLISSVSPSS